MIEGVLISEMLERGIKKIDIVGKETNGLHRAEVETNGGKMYLQWNCVGCDITNIAPSIKSIVDKYGDGDNDDRANGLCEIMEVMDGVEYKQ